jgi:eukaryotic-like serine/threonine-protein kinase
MSSEHEYTTSLPIGEDAYPGHPSRIGAYEILGLLGEGGMGRVYRARESNPPREVALKLLRGLDRGAEARFRREAALLAALEHPGIARLYATGEADFAGLRLPWLAMEYVRGVDLLRYANERGLDLPARLRLLVEVCRAVHYAHGRGVIHRDLKPGNILVDDEGRARVLDFGIARLRDHSDGMTQQGQVLGTVPYMSPEQLAGKTADVDVRADVYALGVIAYELVAQRLPYPRLSTSTVLEALQIVRSETPPRLASLAPKARGDLDLVVMKALASEPARRYGSAAEFAADIERVLDHRPVEARPPTVGYLLARFVRRHRALSAAAGVVLAVLVGATAVSLRYALGEAAARREAEARAAEAAAVNAFLQQMLSAANPAMAQGRTVTVADVLDLAEADPARGAAPTTVQLSVIETLADARFALGDFARGLALSEQGLALARAEGLADHERRLLRKRMVSLTELGRYDEAAVAVEAALAHCGDDAGTTCLGIALGAARLQIERGEFAPAEVALRDLLARLLPRAGAAGGEGEEIATLLDTVRSNLGALLRDGGKLDEAETLAREVFEARRARLGATHPLTLISQQKLGLTEAARDRQPAARATLEAALAGQREVLGPQHPDTLTTQLSLVNTLLQLREHAAAEPLAREAVTAFEAQFGPAHTQTVGALNALGFLLEDSGKPAEAEAIYRRVIAIKHAEKPAHPEALPVRNNLAMLLLAQGRASAAEPEFSSLIDDTRALFGERHPMTLIFTSNHAASLLELGRADEAEKALSALLPVMREVFGDDHARTRTAAERLLRAHEVLGQKEAADALRAQLAAPAS